MTTPADPYRKWLGIESLHRLPTHYELLGLKPLEDDTEVIATAANTRSAKMRGLPRSEHGEVWQRVIDELTEARACLLDRDRKLAYDDALRNRRPLPVSNRIVRPEDFSRSSTPKTGLPGANDLLPPSAAPRRAPATQSPAPVSNPTSTASAPSPASGAPVAATSLPSARDMLPPGRVREPAPAAVAAAGPQLIPNPPKPGAARPAPVNPAAIANPAPVSNPMPPRNPAAMVNPAAVVKNPAPVNPASATPNHGAPAAVDPDMPQAWSLPVAAPSPQGSPSLPPPTADSPYFAPAMPPAAGLAPSPQPPFAPAAIQTPAPFAPAAAPAAPFAPNQFAPSQYAAAPAPFAPAPFATAPFVPATTPAPYAAPQAPVVPSGHAAAPGYAAPGYAPAPGFAPAPGYAPAPGFAPAPGYATQPFNQAATAAMPGATMPGAMAPGAMAPGAYDGYDSVVESAPGADDYHNSMRRPMARQKSSAVPLVLAGVVLLAVGIGGGIAATKYLGKDPTDASRVATTDSTDSAAEAPPAKPATVAPPESPVAFPATKTPGAATGPTRKPVAPANRTNPAEDGGSTSPPATTIKPATPAIAKPATTEPTDPAMTTPAPGPAMDPDKPEMVAMTAKPAITGAEKPLENAGDGVRFRQTLAGVKKLLSERQLAKAAQQLATASSMAKTQDQKDGVHQMSELHAYVDGFWKAVVESLKGLQATDTLKLGSTDIIIVSADADSISFRAEGKNRSYTLSDMPAGVAMALAQRWLVEGKASNKVFLGAFQAVDPAGDPKEAKRLWEEASLGGIDTKPLIATLEGGAGIGGTSAPPGDRLPIPSAEDLEAGKDLVNKEFADALKTARAPANRVTVVQKLLDAAREAKSDAHRYVLLQTARDLAGDTGQFDVMTSCIEELARWFEVDTLRMKAEALGRIRTAPPAQAREIVASAVKLMNDAMDAKRFDLASNIGAFALVMARRSQDNASVRLVTEKNAEVQLLMKAKTDTP